MKEEQLDLEAYARRTDPKTSRDAADSLDGATLAGLEAKVVLAIRKSMPYGLTQHETAEFTGLPYETITPRFAPLVRKQQIHTTGKKRRHPRSKRLGNVYFIGPPAAIVESKPTKKQRLQTELESLRAENKRLMEKLNMRPLTCLEEELGDILIRLLDDSRKLDVDIVGAAIRKHEFNRQRPHRHGGKKS